VNVYEPVVFYPADEKMPVEIVINSITKRLRERAQVSRRGFAGAGDFES
jgi:hypothetical protein